MDKNLININVPNNVQHILLLGPYFSQSITNHGQSSTFELITNTEIILHSVNPDQKENLRRKIVSTIMNHINKIKHNYTKKSNYKERKFINNVKSTKNF